MAQSASVLPAMGRASAVMTLAGDYTAYPGVSDVALPGESVEADPYGALALIEATGQTVAPPVSELAAAGAAPGAAPPAASILTNTFTVAGFRIPYWAVGAALVGWYVLSRKRGVRA